MLKPVYALILPLLGILLLTGCKTPNYHAPSQFDALVASSEIEHGLHSFWGKRLVSSDITIAFRGKTSVDGNFVFEAHGPRAALFATDGSHTVYDGATCWVAPESAASPRQRFHVLTWPWFVIAPFKMRGSGVVLSDYKLLPLNGRMYHTVLQTFVSETGDTPDDWYRLYINPETLQLDAMAYIVTFSKSVEKANEAPHVIVYKDYVTVDGVSIATTYEFWDWKEEVGLVGEGPIGVGTVSNISFPAGELDMFGVSPGAVEVKRPQP